MVGWQLTRGGGKRIDRLFEGVDLRREGMGGDLGKEREVFEILPFFLARGSMGVIVTWDGMGWFSDK